MLADLGDEPVGARDVALEHDERPHVLAAALEVADADDTCVRDRVMAEERLLDLERAEPAPAARDDVVRAAEEAHGAVLVADREVAGHVQVAAEDGASLLGLVPVAG